MKAFKLIKILPYGMLLFSLIVFSGCSGNPMATSPEEIEEGIQNGEYVKMSRSASNQITRGKNVFETVMKKYQPVIDFYGADSEVFQKMVNSNLMMNSESLTSPSGRMFNYDAMALWEDSEIVVEYEDGTKEALLAAEMLTIDGGNNPDWYSNGKKVINYFVKLQKADEIREKVQDKINLITDKFEQLGIIEDGTLTKLATAINIGEFSQIGGICDALVKIGNYAGGIGAAFSIVQTLGIVDLGPSADEVMNMKLDYIIDLIKGMYTHLEFIETRLTQIEDVIQNQFNKEIALNIQSIMYTVDGKIEEISNLQSVENKKTAAMGFIDVINGHLATYISYSETDYANYCEWQSEHDKSNPDYLPIPVQINAPHQRNYTVTSPKDVKIECTLTSFDMTNPNLLIPFTYEGLEYFKNLVTTRMNINSFVETETNLTEYNSNTSLTYLTSSDKYILHLRNKINAAYTMLKQELADTKNNINGPSTGVWTEDDHFTVKDNLNNIITCLNENLIFRYQKVEHSVDGTLVEKDSRTTGNFGSTDKWDYTPWFSYTPSFIPESTLNHYDDCEKTDGKAVVTIGKSSYYDYDYIVLYYEYVTHTFPYAPTITFGTNTPVEFLKMMTDTTFLYDANSAIDAYYKAKTNRLLEFAASLAALEVQLALYLDDEDYAVYAQ